MPVTQNSSSVSHSTVARDIHPTESRSGGDGEEEIQGTSAATVGDDDTEVSETRASNGEDDSPEYIAAESGEGDDPPEVRLHLNAESEENPENRSVRGEDDAREMGSVLGTEVEGQETREVTGEDDALNTRLATSDDETEPRLVVDPSEIRPLMTAESDASDSRSAVVLESSSPDNAGPGDLDIIQRPDVGTEESLSSSEVRNAEHISNGDQSSDNGNDDGSQVDNGSGPVNASQANSGAQRLTPEDENLLKYFVMLRRTGPAATTLAKISVLLYGGGEMSVRDYCINSLGFSSTTYRRTFNAQERETLQRGTDWSQLDITFLYKLLQRVCGLASMTDSVWTSSDPQNQHRLEFILFSVKGERNFLAHEAIVLTDIELQDRTQNLKMLLEKALQEAGAKVNQDLSDDITAMKTAIDEIQNSTSRLTLRNYRDELREFQQSLANAVKHESANELHEVYKQLWEDAPVWWCQGRPPQCMATIGTPQHIEQVFTEYTFTSKCGRQVPLLNLFDFQLPDGRLPQLLIIEGIAGSGKSHACKYILNHWAARRSNDTNLLGFDIVIFIQCHAVTSSTLHEFLTDELLQQTFSAVRQDHVIPCLRKCQVAFIIDGLDEAPPKVRSLVKEIGSKFPRSRVLITCRPEFTSEGKALIAPRNNSYGVLYVKGFTDAQREEYITKLMTIMVRDVDQHNDMIQQLLNELQHLEDEINALLHMPLTMLLYLILWLEDRTALNATATVTRLHQQTVELGVRRLTNRLRQKPEESRHTAHLEFACRGWLLSLAKIAWVSLQQNSQVLDSVATSRLFQDAKCHKIDPVDAMSSFLKCTTKETLLGRQQSWEFLHRANQEYLSAYFVSNCPKQSLQTLQQHFSQSTTIQDPSSDTSPVPDQNQLSPAVSSPPPNDSLFLSIVSIVYGCFKTKKMCGCIKPKSIIRCLTCNHIFHDKLELITDSNEKSYINEGFYTHIDLEGIQECTEYEDDEVCEAMADVDRNKSSLQDMLLFLVAVEVTKDNIDKERLAKIVSDFNQTLGSEKWKPWMCFVRECVGNKLAYRLAREYLDGAEVTTKGMTGKLGHNLHSIYYLVKKTGFVPGKVDLLFQECDPFPQVAISLFQAWGRMKICSDIRCSVVHCEALENLLTQQETLEYLSLSIFGDVENKTNNLLSVIKFINANSATAALQMSLIIKNHCSLNQFISVCCKEQLPHLTELCLEMKFVSHEMTSDITQLFKAFGWQRPLSLKLSPELIDTADGRISEIVCSALQCVGVTVSHVTVKTNDSLPSDVVNCIEEAGSAMAAGSPLIISSSGTDNVGDVIFTIHGSKPG